MGNQVGNWLYVSNGHGGFDAVNINAYRRLEVRQDHGIAQWYVVGIPLYSEAAHRLTQHGSRKDAYQALSQIIRGEYRTS